LRNQSVDLGRANPGARRIVNQHPIVFGESERQIAQRHQPVQHRITTRCAAHPKDERLPPGRVTEMLVNLGVIGGNDNRNGINPLRLLKGSYHMPQQRFTLQHQVLLGDCGTHSTAFASRRYECDMSNRADRRLRF
jgi:hypothetical protein